MEGFININKPQGMTSYDVIRALKPLFATKVKMGHLGTLDPMASGVLPIAVGCGTRIIPYIQDETKEYVADMTLGAVSDTQDAWGNITYTGKVEYSEDKLYDILKSFQGSINQLPPMYSAVHHKGQRLYTLARKGITVERKARNITITALELLQLSCPKGLPVLTVRVLCSSGTYVRTLCHDIGERLGTGAFMSRLVRTRSGVFSLNDAVNLESLAGNRLNIRKHILPLDYPIQDMDSYTLTPGEEERVKNGGVIPWEKREHRDKVRLYTTTGCLLAIAKVLYFNDVCLLKPIRVLNHKENEEF